MLVWNKLLQPKRFREKETVQRSSSDNRSPFKKDFDTVCNSTVLRRLQDKAQVFPLEQEDYARTRLTHSIEVMASFIKYPTPSTKINKNSLLTKKMGYFTSEKELFEKICKELGLKNCRHPLAFLLEAADDIAYLTADIEDAHRKGLISMRKIKDYLEEDVQPEFADRLYIPCCIHPYVAHSHKP